MLIIATELIAPLFYPSAWKLIQGGMSRSSVLTTVGATKEDISYLTTVDPNGYGADIWRRKNMFGEWEVGCSYDNDFKVESIYRAFSPFYAPENKRGRHKNMFRFNGYKESE